MTKLHFISHLAHNHSKTDHTNTHIRATAAATAVAVICVPREREYEHCRFSRITFRQRGRQFTYDRGSCSHEGVGTVFTVKIEKARYNRNK